MKVVYDAGVLVAADRNDRAVWAAHQIRLELGILPAVTAPVISQASRSPQQAQLRRFLRGCDVLPFPIDDAHRVGALLAATGKADVIDAHVVITAAGGEIVTSDPDDIAALAAHAPEPIRITTI